LYIFFVFSTTESEKRRFVGVEAAIFSNAC